MDLFAAWLGGETRLELLPVQERRRAYAWLDAGPSIALGGGPDEPFRSHGTPRGVFHVNLLRALSERSDGEPGWRTPADRLNAHVRNHQQSIHNRRNWTRGYDDEIARSSGSYEFGLLPSGDPLNYAEDFKAAILEETIAVGLRAAVDEDGFRVGINDDEFTALMNVDDLEHLLDAVPRRIRLEDLDAAGYHAHLTRGSAAWDLVDALIAQARLPEATAWSLAARLRPELVPSPDRIVGSLLGLQQHESSRPYWWWALHSDQRLCERLQVLRGGAALEGRQRARLGTLRLAEIVVLQRESDRRLALSTADTLFPFDGGLEEGSI